MSAELSAAERDLIAVEVMKRATSEGITTPMLAEGVLAAVARIKADAYAEGRRVALGLPSADDMQRWDAAYLHIDQDDPPGSCIECGERRTVYCNVDGFGYCRNHYPAGAL